MRIFIIGYMASGKSTLGKLLASKLGYKFIDIDKSFEDKHKIKIIDFFEKYGEEEFRKQEHKLLMENIKYDNVVISTGGGTPCFYNTMKLINKNGISIYLKISVNTLYNRLLNLKQYKPLLKNLSEGKLKKHIEKQLSEREAYYLMAKYVVKEKDINIKNILKLI